MSKHRLAWAVAITATALAGALLAADRSSRREALSGDSPVAAVAVRPGAVTGLTARLSTTSSPATESGFVEWSTTWELVWTPVPGAAKYAVYSATSEGESKKPRMLTEPRLSMTVAGGTSRASDVAAASDGQTGVMGSQLSVSISAVSTDGAHGPRSASISVAEPYPDLGVG